MALIIFLWFSIIALSCILIKLLKINKQIIICMLISILIIIFVKNINTCIPAALEGCKLWYKAILPTTFPFVVICNLLISFDGINLYSKFIGPIICKPLKLTNNCSFPIVASILCGYPLGAKYSADVYTKGYIEKEEYSRLLNIASNVGPLFLIGSVGAALLNNVVLGYIMIIANYLSCIIIGFLTIKKRASSIRKAQSPFKTESENVGTSIKNAIQNGISTVLNIGGFIIMFSVIISLIKNNIYIAYIFEKFEDILNLSSGTLYGLFLGSIEITNGCSILSELNINIPLKLALISFLCSFSGLAIIAQVSSFVSETNVNYLKYISLKLLQGIISFVITYILSCIIPTSVYTSSFTNSNINTTLNIVPFLILLVLTLILIIKDKLFLHTS